MEDTRGNCSLWYLFLFYVNFMFIEGEVIMTADDVLNNLLELIGKPFDYDDVVCAFEDYEENGECSVYVGESCNDGYSYIAYIDEVNSTQFLFKTDDNDVIKAVYMKGR